MSLPRGVFGFLLCVLVSGCASQHRAKELVKNEDFVAHYDTIMQGQEQRSVGAIYAPSASAFLRGDKRARNVGDILTVQLVENTTGASSAKNAGKRQGSHGLSVSSPIAAAAGGLLNSMASLVMSKRAAGSVSESAEDILGSNKISTDHSFKGEGLLEKSNEMRGFVTVTVERVFHYRSETRRNRRRRRVCTPARHHPARRHQARQHDHFNPRRASRNWLCRGRRSLRRGDPGLAGSLL